MLTIERGWEKTVRVRGGRHPLDINYTLYHVTRPEEIQVVCDWYDRMPMVLIDTETGGLDPWKDGLATIQLGYPVHTENDPPTAFVIDYRLFTLEQLKPLLDRFASRKKMKLGQNIKFELRFIGVHCKTKVRNVWDTQIAEMVIRAGLFGKEENDDDDRGAAYGGTSMQALGIRYLNITIDKGMDVRMSFLDTPAGAYNDRQLTYAAGDVIYPYFIKLEQDEEIRARALESVIKLEMRTIPVTAEAELRGILLDTKQWLALYQESVTGKQAALQKLHTLLRNAQQQELFDGKPSDRVYYPKNERPVDFDSPKQVQWAIQAYCESVRWPYKVITDKRALFKLKAQYGKEWLQKRYDRTKGDKPPFAEFAQRNVERVPDYLIPSNYVILVSTSADELRLARVTKRLPREIVDLLLEHAKHSIRCDTFGNPFIKYVQSDGRIHTEFHQAKTTTGRYSTTPNLQNIPRDRRYRKCFYPAPGYKFVIADYSQQEPRLSAQASQDPLYLSTYINDEDLYLNVGEVMLGHRPDTAAAEAAVRARAKLEREVMKTVVLAMAYRMGPTKLYRKLLLALEWDILEGRIEMPTYEYVRELHAKFLDRFSKLLEYQEKCSNDAHPSSSRKIWDRYVEAPVTWASACCGRKRFFRPDAEDTYTAAANSPIQGAAASMSKAAAVMIQDYIDRQGIDAGAVDMVHDELVYECREDQAEEFAKVVKTLMERAGKFYLPDIPCKAEFPKNTHGVVDYWTKEVELEAVAA